MATFLASFPPIQSAIKIGQDGMRIQLDVPETEMGNAIELLAMRGVVLSVTIEPVKNTEIHGESRTQMATRRDRKSKWQAAQEQGVDRYPGSGREQDT